MRGRADTSEKVQAAVLRSSPPRTRIQAADKVMAFTEADGDDVASDPSCPTPVMPDGVALDTEALAALGRHRGAYRVQLGEAEQESCAGA